MRPDAPGSIVLLVDDDEMDRFLTRAALDRAGYSVVEAEDGAQALELARATRPRVMVVDCLMPGMDGIDLCRRVRSIPSLEGTSLVMMTGLEDPGLPARAQEAGVDRLLVKSADPGRLLAALAGLAG
jgi:CheY-like chemotaxis protein